MDRNRLLELALQELNRQRAALDADIEVLRAELKSSGSAPQRAASTARAAGTGKRRQRTAAERKAHSRKMREIWAARKAKAAQSPAAAKLSEKAETQKKTGRITKASPARKAAEPARTKAKTAARSAAAREESKKTQAPET